MSAISSDLEAILSKQKGEQDRRQHNGFEPPEAVGSHQKKTMVRPKPGPNMLNKEMAEAAAIKFKQKEKRIQQACKELDGEETGEEKPLPEPKVAKKEIQIEEEPQGCACILL